MLSSQVGRGLIRALDERCQSLHIMYYSGRVNALYTDQVMVRRNEEGRHGDERWIERQVFSGGWLVGWCCRRVCRTLYTQYPYSCREFDHLFHPSTMTTTISPATYRAANCTSTKCANADLPTCRRNAICTLMVVCLQTLSSGRLPSQLRYCKIPTVCTTN
jgi:hypothetical protein